MRIRKQDTLALIIDVQEKLYPYIHENEKLANNIVRLVKGLKALGMEIIVTEQYSKGLGSTISQVREALGDYRHIEKMSFSCCGSEEFCGTLRLKEKKNIIVAGIESHVCVLQTVLDLIDKGYSPILAEDCVSSRNPNDKKIAVERMRSEGAVITTYESVLFELLGVSGTEEFRAVSRIVK